MLIKLGIPHEKSEGRHFEFAVKKVRHNVYVLPWASKVTDLDTFCSRRVLCKRLDLAALAASPACNVGSHRRIRSEGYNLSACYIRDEGLSVIESVLAPLDVQYLDKESLSRDSCDGGM